jgi:hypothetical protein
VTIFGIPWAELTLDRLRVFLGDAGHEALLWEAKGTELSSRELRVQVCGFANSHEGGYLILGASQDGNNWSLDGVEFPTDPPTWVTSVVGSGGVLPYPDGLDTKPFAVGSQRHVAVVWSHPLRRHPATPVVGYTRGCQVRRSLSGNPCGWRPYLSAETKHEQQPKLDRDQPRALRCNEGLLDRVSREVTFNSGSGLLPRGMTPTSAVDCSASLSSNSRTASSDQW